MYTSPDVKSWHTSNRQRITKIFIGPKTRPISNRYTIPFNCRITIGSDSLVAIAWRVKSRHLRVRHRVLISPLTEATHNGIAVRLLNGTKSCNEPFIGTEAIDRGVAIHPLPFAIGGTAIMESIQLRVSGGQNVRVWQTCDPRKTI